MEDSTEQSPATEIENDNETGRKFEISGGQDLPDTPEDEEKMKTEETVIDLPDVKDIPGQEHIRPPVLGMMADTTISSDDEEGVGLFDDEDDSTEDNIGVISGNSADVTGEEKNALEQADEDMLTEDDIALRRAGLDNTDEEGEPLNEKGFGDDVSGRDIDVPGSEEDDANEDIGEEDEENNSYSLEDNDDTVESN